MFMRKEINNNNQRKLVADSFSIWKVILPIFIGLGVVVYLFINDAKEQNIGTILNDLVFNYKTIMLIGLAWLFMIGRDFGLSWRFRHLTGKQLSWRKAIKVCFLCEFTSCVTPSSVGGSTLGMIYLHHEGIEFGRATTLMITTLFLDELFFVVACPIVMLITPINELFSTPTSSFSQGIQYTFFVVYTGIIIWTIILFWGLIINPHIIRRLLLGIFTLPFIKRWRKNIEALSNNIITTSREIRKKGIIWWLKAFGATLLSWTSRYLVVNALFMAFVPSTISDQWIIWARQLIVWVTLTISPTPGGSGISEWIFTEFYSEFIPTIGLTLILALSWRIISYYIYLIIGCCLLPKWIKETFSRLKKD